MVRAIHETNTGPLKKAFRVSVQPSSTSNIINGEIWDIGNILKLIGLPSTAHKKFDTEVQAINRFEVIRLGLLTHTDAKEIPWSISTADLLRSASSLDTAPGSSTGMGMEAGSTTSKMSETDWVMSPPVGSKASNKP